MSNKVESGIFNAIIGYFKEFKSDDIEIYVTEKPLDNMDIHHYHRPNLENELIERSVVTVHHDLEDNDVWFDKNNFINIYKEANKIICLNNKQKKILESLNITNTIVIPHGYNNKIFTNKVNKKFSNEKKITLGFVSKRYARRVKGEAYLLELFKRLDIYRFNFTFVGEGRNEDYLLAKKFGFEANLYESLPYSMFNQLYNDIDFLLVLSLFEGGPANIPEAIATNTPIIGNDIAMVSDYVKNKENGFILSGDINKDIKVFNEISYNKDNITQKVYNNVSNTKNLLTWYDVVQKHFELYENLVGNNCFKKDFK